MTFDHHAFISYAIIDNKPLSPEQEGWVTRLHATFEALLSMRIGESARIWRDAKLQGNDSLSGEIFDRIGRTALLVTVLTPRYLESDWCTRELVEFCARVDRSGGIAPQNKSRVLKVLKTPVPLESVPESIRDTLGYAFFVMEDGTPMELDAAYGTMFAQHYNRMVCKLAWDAAQLLKQLAGEATRAARPDAVSRVYLAECSHDRQRMRERLEADLRRRGYVVLPDRRLPLEDEAECIRMIGDCLARSCLAIHLIGSQPGAVPDGVGGQSIVVMQNQLAAERSRSHALPRLIWLPAGAQSPRPEHQSFIDALQRDAAAQFGADLLTGSGDALLQAVHDTLGQMERKASAPPATPTMPAISAAPMLYLICVEQDRKSSIPLRHALRDCGFEVHLPAFQGDAAAVRESHRRLLAECDVVLVYYGAGEEAWKRSVDSELKKGALQGRAAVPRYTYLAEPRSSDKEDLIDMQEDRLIDGLGGVSMEAIAAFAGALRTARGTVRAS